MTLIMKKQNTRPSKDLYTPMEQKIVNTLLERPWTDKVERVLELIQKRHVKREVRIIENKPNKNDLKNGYTQKEFPWLAQFNY